MLEGIGKSTMIRAIYFILTSESFTLDSDRENGITTGDDTFYKDRVLAIVDNYVRNNHSTKIDQNFSPIVGSPGIGVESPFARGSLGLHLCASKHEECDKEKQ